MFTNFEYDIIEDEICPGKVYVEVCKATLLGIQTTNLWDVDLQCLRRVTALMFRSGSVNYGKIDMTIPEWVALCCEDACSIGGGPEPGCGIFTCEFDCVFK